MRRDDDKPRNLCEPRFRGLDHLEDRSGARWRRKGMGRGRDQLEGRRRRDLIARRGEGFERVGGTYWVE